MCSMRTSICTSQVIFEVRHAAVDKEETPAEFLVSGSAEASTTSTADGPTVGSKRSLGDDGAADDDTKRARASTDLDDDDDVVILE